MSVVTQAQRAECPGTEITESHEETVRSDGHIYSPVRDVHFIVVHLCQTQYTAQFKMCDLLDITYVSKHNLRINIHKISKSNLQKKKSFSDVFMIYCRNIYGNTEGNYHSQRFRVPLFLLLPTFDTAPFFFRLSGSSFQRPLLLSRFHCSHKLKITSCSFESL